MTSRYGDAIAAQAVTELLAEAWGGGGAERTVDLYGPPRRTLHVHAALIDDGRRPLGVLAMIEDVSERRRLEEIRRDFIANVSHELKTPMGALGLLAETLLVERDPAVASRLAERIHLEAFRVSRIIDDLLDLSRLESEGTPARELVPVVLVMAEAIERIRVVRRPARHRARLRRARAERHRLRRPAPARRRARARCSRTASRTRRRAARSRCTRPSARRRSTTRRPTGEAVGDEGGAEPPRRRPSLRTVRDLGHRQGHRHPREGPRPDLRALLPRRPGARAPDRRDRARPRRSPATSPRTTAAASRSSPARARARRSRWSCRCTPSDARRTKARAADEVRPLVLLVEDEESFVDALRIGLDREGFDVVVATDGAQAHRRRSRRRDPTSCCST